MKQSIPAGHETGLPPTGSLLSPLEIVDVSVEGQGLARHNGRVVFLDGGLPGAMVSAMVKRVTKKVIFADIVSVLNPSPHQISPACPHAGLCGGCLWQDFDLEAARQWKRNHISQCLARIGKAPDVQVFPVAASPAYVAMRNKMSFAFGPGQDESCLLGLRKRAAHDIVEVDSCLLQGELAMAVVAHVRKRANELGLKAWIGEKEETGYLRHLVVHKALHATPENSMLVECITGPPPRRGKAAGKDLADKLEQIGKELMQQFGVTGFVHGVRLQKDELALAERTFAVLGEASYTETIGHLNLVVPHNAFLQSNTAAATLLYERIRQEAALQGTECVWDLFCGIGSIGLFLAQDAGQVHGCEVAEQSVRAARQNARRLGYDNCAFYRNDLAHGLGADLPPPDVIIMDPPRAGISERLAGQLAQIKARTLLYVSCDAGTQARDVARLSSTWRAVRSYPVDMFPYTAHVENVLVLEPLHG